MTPAERLAQWNAWTYRWISLNAGELDGNALIEMNNLACGYVTQETVQQEIRNVHES